MEKSHIDRAEVLRRIRAHWLSNATHDLRGPLFAARGYTKMMLDERAGRVTEEQRRFLTTILDNLNRLANLTDELQSFPTDDALRLEPISLTELLRTVVQDWRGPAGKKLLHLVENIPVGPIETTGDRDKLGLAAHKLLGAAVEFTGPGGRVEVQAQQKEDEITILISATPTLLTSGAPNGVLDTSNQAVFDLSTPCEILRLHGGTTSVRCSSRDGYRVLCQLPLIRSLECKGVAEANG